MHRPPAIAATLALLLAGCTATTNIAVLKRTPSVSHIPLAELDITAPHRTTAGQLSGSERSGPASVAAATVLGLLEAEGLYVLDLDVAVTERDGRRATVTVAVLHGTGRGYPHDSRYELTLTRSAHGWEVTAIEAAP